MILYGASGHGKVVYSICGDQVICFFDDNEELEDFRAKPVRKYDASYKSEIPLVISIGDNKIRKSLAQKVDHFIGKVISLSAVIDKTVIIGSGAQVIHKSLIQADVIIGKHSIVNSMSSIDHDCEICDFAHIAPNSTLCGNVTVGEGTLIGAGSVIMPGMKIGKWCVVAAGSVVTKHVPDFAQVAGNPARIIKYCDEF